MEPSTAETLYCENGEESQSWPSFSCPRCNLKSFVVQLPLGIGKHCHSEDGTIEKYVHPSSYAVIPNFCPQCGQKITLK